ncbi:hypothetical protein LLEC1_05493 [Akanthomyces lecanii]|uniref:Phosphoribosyltransferase domain-containing protein n=1 Tax=Cordyceps confragosa TaxID=2714763 RepID=A0A179I9F5_CORDF|nr:hypothetical protein LLEC1_05493 [Akanthomyces lecanii]
MQGPILRRWHGFLRLARQSPSWYRERLREELLERREALTPMQKLSETADVFYILSRAMHDGYPLQTVTPYTPIPHIFIYTYMIAKFTSRWLFYRVAARLCRTPNAGQVREVINPAKEHKVGEVAFRHGLDRSDVRIIRDTNTMATSPVLRVSSSSLASDFDSTRVSEKKPLVIGLYGLPGSGKSTLINRMKLELELNNFDFYEGSELISTIVTGGLAAFQGLDQEDKRLVRQRAIASVAEDCLAQQRAAMVAGHYMFWPQGDLGGDVVATATDFHVYTHIIYLDIPAHTILERRKRDVHRHRPMASAAHLQQWQRAEIDQLRDLCRQHSVLFSVVPKHTDKFAFVLKLLRHFEQTKASCNFDFVLNKVEAALFGQDRAGAVLVIDADKTLSGDDAGYMYWQALHRSGHGATYTCPLTSLFSGPLGYSEAAFRQATLLYEESANDEEFEALCERLATSITIHPEFMTLFQLVRSHSHLRAIVLTCGIRRVWQLVLNKAGLGHMIKVIGGGRILDEVVVTPKIKGEIVSSLRKHTGLYVWAFGDSPLDLPMLEAANRSIVVSGDAQNRSRTMDDALRDAMDTRGLCSLQVLLPPHATPRLDTRKLPVIAFSDPDFLEAVVRRRKTDNYASAPMAARTCGWTLVHATNTTAAKLLMSPTRDASVAGPRLRKAHEEVGKFLGLHCLSEVIGVEEFDIPHVQGHRVAGFRLADESQTTIVALMRGGEPMAFGINEAFPRAMLVHAHCPEDIKLHHAQTQKNLILVDSVVNSGKSIVEFLQHVSRLKKDLKNIVVVAGVVQEETVAGGHALREMLEQNRIKMVALRVSSNKFTGTKATDTGNRLFNTTHLA